MKIIKIDEDRIEFDNGYTLTYYHNQDCCENVYADFKNMQVNNLIITEKIDVSKYEFSEELLDNIECIKDVGFNLITKDGIKILVSCYNSQNGYYSSDLELILTKNNGVSERKDISDCVHDDIY